MSDCVQRHGKKQARQSSCLSDIQDKTDLFYLSLTNWVQFYFVIYPEQCFCLNDTMEFILQRVMENNLPFSQDTSIVFEINFDVRQTIECCWHI